MMRYALAVLFILQFGCDPIEDDVTNPQAGNGGEAAVAGSGGEAGSGGDAGSGGNAGDAGAGGEAGSAGDAGAGGDVGSGGEAGSGGDAGTSGNAGSGGNGGAGGEAGSGGNAGAGGEGGEAGMTPNLCESVGGICRAGQACESGEARIRTACSSANEACCLPDDQCMDTDQDGACDSIDSHCNTDDLQLTCRQAEPNCEENTVPEVRDGCFTTRCVTWDECVYDPGTETRCRTNADCAPGERCDAGGCLPCVCEEGLSVCGADGRTYPNECAAQCANVDVIAQSICSLALLPCGGFLGAACLNPTDTCIDNPDDNCDPNNGGSDCVGMCLPAPITACTEDTDCSADQWCRETATTNERICVPYQQEGESCGGFNLPQFLERCDPELACATTDPLLPDAPGICARRCANDESCTADQYCAVDSICRTDGTCLQNDDCEKVGNDYLRPLCLGNGVCERNPAGFGLQCGWMCNSDRP